MHHSPIGTRLGSKEFTKRVSFSNPNYLTNLVLKSNLELELEVNLTLAGNIYPQNRINCDMTKVTRALSQFLVTADYRIVANDLDDLPEVTSGNLPNCTWGKIEDRDPSFQVTWLHIMHIFKNLK